MNLPRSFLTTMTLMPTAFALVLLAGCQTAPSPVADMPALAAQTLAQQVTIDNFNFTPSTVTVAAGTRVTWTNHDDVPHTVTADDKRFTSAALDTDQHFTHVFTDPGTYPYFCAVHPHMTGRIIVK
jgi:plastocyanin